MSDDVKPLKVLLVSDIWPNLALGRYATYYRKKGAEVYRHCNNPDTVVCSWNYNRNKNQTGLWAGAEVIEGGALIDPAKRLPPEVEACAPDLDFLRINYGIGRRTTGCPNKCPWCCVPLIWGNKVVEHEGIEQIAQGRERVMLLDDNLPAYHGCVKVLDEIAECGLKMCLPSGWDARLTTDAKAEALSRVDYYSQNWKNRYIYIAFDNTKDEERVKRGVEILSSYGVAMMGYALGGYPDGDEFDDVFYRCERLIEWGVDPYLMPYARANHKIRRLKRLITLRVYRKVGLREAWRRYRG